jgi:F0F1-type ATP synthase membrane subunit c/vacuolar-type H+-ATPase subunit K
MKSGLAAMYYSLLSFPTAGLAWGLMWVTDKLYDWGVWFIAVPIRIITFIMQIAVLFGCLTAGIGIVFVTATFFHGASRGQDSDSGNTLSVKGYILFLLLPVAMGVASLLAALFHNWLNFGEHGLGLITFGYVALDWVLEIGSLVIVGIWLVILPIFLRKHHMRITG